MTAAAYLRVYLPVEALNSSGIDLPQISSEKRGGSLRTAVGVGLVSDSMIDDVLIAEWKGSQYGCPRRSLLRAMEGLLAFRTAYAGVGGELMVPERVAQRAAAHLEAIYEQPMARSYILTSAWHVPLRWFSVFEPTEREVFQVEGVSSIRYRTSRRLASGRLDEVIGVLRAAGMGDGVVSEIEELSEWINEHPEDALLELDYGSVAGLFEEPDLILDESSSDIWESISALATGDWETATAHYMAVAMRWAGPMAVAFSS